MKKLFILIAVLFCLVGLAFADAEIADVPVIDQDIYEDIFGERYLCGPTTVSEVMGYWSENGYPNLAGPLLGEIPETSDAMTSLLRDTIYNWSGWIRGLGNYPEDLAQGIRNYTDYRGYDFEVMLGSRGRASWGDTTDELDAGRPVILLLWNIPHYVVVTGYTDNPRQIDILYGHIPFRRTWSVAGLPFGDLQTIFIRPQGGTPPPPPPPPDPTTETWYDDVMAWCEANGWELEEAD